MKYYELFINYSPNLIAAMCVIAIIVILFLSKHTYKLDSNLAAQTDLVSSKIDEIKILNDEIKDLKAKLVISTTDINHEMQEVIADLQIKNKVLEDKLSNQYPLTPLPMKHHFND
ncbi:MAG: hypothetical protein JKY50_21305 [Oleispira sp.]|nr:hypothetical protein [Oleispira sp.]MBL4799944.1 hypothetical protein [Oleispira sp.]MBL4882095.1 hypothetical protein [Oleispira sp.]